MTYWQQARIATTLDRNYAQLMRKLGIAETAVEKPTKINPQLTNDVI